MSYTKDYKAFKEKYNSKITFYTYWNHKIDGETDEQISKIIPGRGMSKVNGNNVSSFYKLAVSRGYDKSFSWFYTRRHKYIINGELVGI